MCQLAALYTAWHWYIGTLANYSYLYGNEDYDPIFSMEEVSIDGIVTLARCCTLSFSERNVPFPGEQSCFTCTCFTALHVHVSLSYMYMFYCFTCTS